MEAQKAAKKRFMMLDRLASSVNTEISEWAHTPGSKVEAGGYEWVPYGTRQGVVKSRSNQRYKQAVEDLGTRGW